MPTSVGKNSSADRRIPPPEANAMGLDQYAYTFPTTNPDLPETDLALPEDVYRIQYWRKHPNLEGWMAKLYREKGGKQQEFNCATVQLTSTDLDRLERDIYNGDLPHTEGFFFGKSHPEDFESDKEFLQKAREAIAQGHVVVYTSWW